MTNSELQNWLQDFGDHLTVIVEVSENVNGGDLCIESLDTTELDGETVLCITFGPDVV